MATKILDFTTGLLNFLVSFSRSNATATRVNASGLREVVAADAARFDYDPGSQVCRGLLIEPQRANLITYSESSWTAEAGTISDDVVAAPDGNTTGDKFVSNSTSGVAHGARKSYSTTIGVTYTYSISVKSAEYSKVRIADTAYSAFAVSYDLNTLSRTSFGGSAFVGSSIRLDANGWHRISITFTATQTLHRFSTVGTTSNYDLSSGAQFTGAGDNVSGIYVWGAQLEIGSEPTTYIPNLATGTTTRNADDALITGTNFSSFWQAGRGGVLVRALPSTVSGTRPLVQFDDNTADNIIALRGNTTNPELYIRSGGVDQATIDAGTISAAAYRLAGTWAAGNAAASLNSDAAVLGAPGAIPAATQARLGSDGTNYLNGHLQALEYYDSRISNTGLRMVASTAGSRSMLQPIINRII